jgi:hypothetical protein
MVHSVAHLLKEFTLCRFDENSKTMLLRFPKELDKAYQAGKTLASG